MEGGAPWLWSGSTHWTIGGVVNVQVLPPGPLRAILRHRFLGRE